MATTLSDPFSQQREQMVHLIQRKGIKDSAVCRAFRNVPREAFLPEELQEFAYRDTPLPIGNEQTISQPYIVALMAELLLLKKSDRVLEVGTGSGYAAAILSQIAANVYTVERYADLAVTAQQRLQELGYENVHVLLGDGTTGWPEQSPYDAIIVAAGGPDIPQPLLDQLKVGGRLVIPVGRERDFQQLIRVTRTAEQDYQREEWGDVRFVPLVGTAGWKDPEMPLKKSQVSTRLRARSVSELIAENAEPFLNIENADLEPLINRIGDCQLVLIGEATHGTSDFYRMRARITQKLIKQGGFRFVAIEADWPDAARLNHYVQSADEDAPNEWQAFARFPTWMWRNQEVLEFVEWLREYNQQQEEPVGIYGLDLYSMHTSIGEVLSYLDRVDPEAALVARERYGCLSPWESDPATYGRAILSGTYRQCEAEVVQMLQDLFSRRLEYTAHDGARYFNAARNAQLVASAEKYYRRMYYGGIESWNLRDTHMFETLQSLREYYGGAGKGVVWEHNSHLGDAAATELGLQGEINVGRLCRKEWGEMVYLIGQGTDHGTVIAASAWDQPHQIMNVRPSQKGSYEHLCHSSGVNNFFLPLKHSRSPELQEQLAGPMPERAIGVIYRPQTEMQSHYFHASLPRQFDEWIWFDKTQAVHPILESESKDYLQPHPFAILDR